MSEDDAALTTAFRGRLLDFLRRELFGPGFDAGPEEQAETLEHSPLQLYATGVLFPRSSRFAETAEELGPEGSSDADPQLASEGLGADVGRRASATEGLGGSEDQVLNLANEFSPSAMGITFRVPLDTRVHLTVTAGKYEKRHQTVPHPKAGQTRPSDGRPWPATRDIESFVRAPLRLELGYVAAASGEPLRDSIPETGDGLQIRLQIRASHTSGVAAITAVLVNMRPCDASGIPEVRDTFFQCRIAVRAEEPGARVFLPIDRADGLAPPSEQASADLLYRHRRSFALGHGCAGDWTRGEEVEVHSRTSEVMTVCVPTYEVRSVRPRLGAYRVGSIDLGMRFLSGAMSGGWAERRSAILASLEALCADYGAWIADMESEAQQLPSHLQGAARSHLASCRTCETRMKDGVRVLQDDDTALRAFLIANRAMLMQQIHYALPAREWGSSLPPEDYSETSATKPRSWRPFQLAFILMNIAGLTLSGHGDRSVVDVIWFPTGGGKTEAYLGLAAYAITLRRLRKARDVGTAVLMRYTLRLLTTQQFQRAATLILALEAMREDPPIRPDVARSDDLGQGRISIGLWVGDALSPNTRADARASLRELRRRGGGRRRSADEEPSDNRFHVLRCPWCGLSFEEPPHLGYVDERDTSGERTVHYRCPDERCRWGRRSTRLPVSVVDEDLYEAPPTLLIGTVDKFAQVAWKNETGRFFGVGSSDAPPDLIIQDELHLISGPLGSVVGAYEAVVERLASASGSPVKIVASTATIRRASEQCRALYAREAFEFPPAALVAGDTYFAAEDREGPGRLYVGIFASGVKSHATAQVRVGGCLLQGVAALGAASPLVADAVVDPYFSLVWYFNTLRELGHGLTMCQQDIGEHMFNMCRRHGWGDEYRRRLHEIIELTSRRGAEEIPQILAQLERRWRRQRVVGSYPVDVLLATNMISVGVDINRLGLMQVSGQPKSTSEYIQATSRVGRVHPGLVVTIYNTAKSRDRSHYESFIAYHQSLYRFVEPTSVTPFAPPARDRTLRGVLIALARLLAAVHVPTEIMSRRAALSSEIDRLARRIGIVDPQEAAEAEAELRSWVKEWERSLPEEYGRMGGRVDRKTLAYPYGTNPDPDFQEDAWPILTSMRNVDAVSRARVSSSYSRMDDSGEKQP